MPNTLWNRFFARDRLEPIPEAPTKLVARADFLRKNLNAAHIAMQDARNAGDQEHADDMARAIKKMEETLIEIAREQREAKAGFDNGWGYR